MFDRSSIDTIIQRYSDIILDHEIITDSFQDDKYVFEMRIKFKDESKLENRDVYLFLENIVKRRYKFQWMKSDNSLIMRWDNADHHPQIKTFPFHLHRKKNENVEESPEMTLDSVLYYIQNQGKY